MFDTLYLVCLPEIHFWLLLEATNDPCGHCKAFKMNVVYLKLAVTFITVQTLELTFLEVCGFTVVICPVASYL